jgi:AP-1 complex subunit gamma-1
MGDEPAAAVPVPGVGGSSQANEDLLSQIFGGGSTTSATNTAPSAPQEPGKQSINDILGLFNSTAPSATATTSSLATLSQSTPSLFSPSTEPSIVPQQRPAAAQRPTGYVAYDKNSLKISLNPQVSAQRPGVVLVTASFEVTGTHEAQKVNFQAAVPKVSRYNEE